MQISAWQPAGPLFGLPPPSLAPSLSTSPALLRPPNEVAFLVLTCDCVRGCAIIFQILVLILIAHLEPQDAHLADRAQWNRIENWSCYVSLVVLEVRSSNQYDTVPHIEVTHGQDVYVQL